MRVVAAALLAAIVLGACVSAQAVDTTDATFDEVIKSSELVLMEFYAPWCGHCKKLEPEWNKAAEQLKDVAVLAKLDATKETVSAGKFGIQGYPTIKVFRDGVLSGDFQGGRTAPEIVKYVKANVGPAVRAIASADELTALKTEQNVAVVFFADALGGEAFEAFESVAKKLRGEFTFAAVSDSTLASAESVTSGSVVLFKQFDEKKVVFDGDAKSAEAIEDFVKGNGVPHFDEIGPHNYKMYVDRKLPMVWVFTTPSDEATKAAGQAAAPGYKGKMSFVWIDSSKYAGMAQRLGLAGDKFPAVAIDNNGKHFAMPEGDITADSLKAFADKFLSGELAATIRSEAEPAEHTVNGLTTITGKTFESLVSNADVDVFIEFYAPWCGHCKQLAPVYEEVAKELADEPIRVAKIDATANDFPQDTFAVQGFPTMFYVPKATRKPVQYEGGRTKDALLEFLKSKLA